jgi:hypothetical protein
MPLYSYICKNNHEYEEALSLDEYDKKTRCPKCKCVGEKSFKTRQTEPSFTDKLYPYWDKALNKVFNNPTERKTYLKSQGLEEKPTKNKMTPAQEREMYACRIGYHDPRDRRHAN